MRLFRFAPLLALLLVVGCDSNESTAEIGGTYTANVSQDGVSGSYRLVIPTTDTGTFTLGSGSQVVANIPGGGTVNGPITGTGRYDYPNVSMTLTLTLAGESETDTVTGTVSASGDTMTLRDSDGATLLFNR